MSYLINSKNVKKQMKKKRKRIIDYSIIISVIILLLIIAFSTNVVNIQEISESVRRQLYGDPIDLETGLINNEYFGISSDGKNAEETTKGLNEAIEYASNNSINYIKLEKGEYLVNNSIEIFSNLEFNLNSSCVIMEQNSSTHYSIFRILNKNNVKVKNGKLRGDRDVHKYSEGSTHEWGMGIRIEGSKNIEIKNIEIMKMTGDGIYVTRGLGNSKFVIIQNCVIHENRRQGISIISGENVEISNNEIYNIKGTSPQSGIDLEANYDYQKIDNIYIYNNKLYDFGSRAIKLYNQIYNVKIESNTIYGSINIEETKEKTEIINNKLIDGIIYAGSIYEDSEKRVNNIDITNNNLNNYTIEYNNKVNNINMEENLVSE